MKKMNMAPSTKKALETAKTIFGDKEFTLRDWENADLRLTMDTAVYHGGVIKTAHVTREYYTVAEIVEELNNCAGSDCYGCDWKYQIDENGRIYQDFTEYTYRMA